VRTSFQAVPDTKLFDEFPKETTFDVVVVGGGPNGLIAGAYLSKAGLKTLVVEKRHEIGGGLATEETLFPGFYTNPHAIYHLMVDYIPVLKDFDLSTHGVTFIKPNIQTAQVFSDGSSLVFCQQIEDTKDSMAKFSPKDARNFGQLMRKWHKMVDGILAPGTYLPPLSPIDMIEALGRTEFGTEALRLTEMSPIEIIDENFTNDKIKTLMLYMSCMWGLNPNDSGLGFLVPLLIDRGLNKAQCYGGSHKLAGALSREIHKAGGLILDNSEVTNILIEDGHVAGVVCADDRVIKATAVLSSLPPPLTFGKLIDQSYVPDELKENAENWEWDPWSFLTVSVATKNKPIYNCDDPWVNDALMVVLGFDSYDQLIEHFNAVLSGKLTANGEMGGHVTLETTYDPTLPRVPGHEIGFIQCHVPNELEGGWDSHKEQAGNDLLKVWQSYTTNFENSSVVKKSIEDPTDIETRIASMVKGSIKHGDYNPLQMGVFRPHDSCVGGRSPIEGLYLCGASSYPGGLIIGGPGYIAANTLAEDLEIDKWWKLPNFVSKYKDIYLS
jgi:phytoene dehydrogenase-like protein